MKKLFFIVCIVLFSMPVVAKHIAGGELMYEYLGDAGGGASNYRITLRLFRDCSSTGPLLEREVVTVGFYNETNTLVNSLSLPLVSGVSSISLNTSAFPCLVGNVRVCYEVALYSNTITLPNSANGYTLSRTGCCRVDNISGLSQSSSVGSNYVTRIPGTNDLPSGHNSSPTFNVRDTALVCAQRKFTLDFGATDADNDSLTYSFCDAYATRGSSPNQPPASILSLIPLPYAAPYSGLTPLGAGVTIDPSTGIISGIAPPEGQYVVNVCVKEWRNGKAFSEHRKDFILKVQNCDIVEAVLPSKIISCDSNIVHFENLSSSSGITAYRWDFGDPLDTAPDSTATPRHVYQDTGVYTVRLTIKGPKGCEGSDSAKVIVFPGFSPAFTVNGSCYFNPYQFTDATITKYGIVNSWTWHFDDGDQVNDTSSRQHPAYTYKLPGTSNVRLLVTNSKGCIDSVFNTVIVRDKPLVKLPFRDTLICSIDTLPINIPGTGVFSWAPNTNILYPNTQHPLFFPKDTIKYIVTVNDNGCKNTDTVTVNVLKFITVQLPADTSICRTDTFTLHPVSHALSYQWTPATSLSDPHSKYPTASPLSNTSYSVTANLGKCQATAQVFVRVAPYPVANITSPDTSICFGNRVLLGSSYTGTGYKWSPANTLFNANTLTPLAGPTKSTTYLFTVNDTSSGCPKPVSDSIRVTVVPMIEVNAGKDTAVVADQLLQLTAIAPAANRFVWSPPTGLSQVNIYNPIAQLGSDTDSVKYKVTAFGLNGCFGVDDIVVRVFKSQPEIFIPSAFTPNADGKNDILKPFPVGISQLHYFRVFNRWGQLLFSTSVIGQGWDGTFNGIKQPPANYVYMAEGIDYTGKLVFRKGNCVLIR